MPSSSVSSARLSGPRMLVMPSTEAWVGVSPSSREAALSCRASLSTTRLRRITVSLSMPDAPSFTLLQASSMGLHRILVVAVDPRHALLVAAERGPVEPLPHAPHRVAAAGVGRVGVVDGIVFAREGAHPVRFEGEDAGIGRHLPEVVLRAAGRALLRERHAKVEVEDAAAGRDPGETPAHPL